MHGIRVTAALLSLVWSVPAQAQVAGPGSWTDKIPGPRLHLHGVIASGGYLYAYGGRYVTPSRTYRFDPVLNTWTQMSANMPAANWGFGAAAYGGTCYAFGNGASASGAIYAFDTATETWTTLSATLGVPRRLAVATVLGDRIYICGGRLANNAYSSAVEEFDPSTGNLRPRAALPAPAANGMVGAIGGLLYFAGGFDGAGSRSTVWRYNPQPNTWEDQAPMPGRRHGAAAFVLGQRLFVAGGADGASTFSSECLEYSPIDKVWALRAALPSPGARYSNGGCAIAGRGYVFGGRNSASTDSTTPDFDACQEFTPPAVGQPPSDPTAPIVRTAGGRLLTAGDATNETNFDFSISAADVDGTRIALEVEVGPAATGPFAPAYRAMSAFQPNGTVTVPIAGIAAGDWIWRCRVWDIDDNANPGGWTRFGGPGIDFTVDLTPPPTPTGLSPNNVDIRHAPSTIMVPSTEFTWSNPVEPDPPVEHEIWVVELRRDLQLYDVGKWMVSGSPAYVPIASNPLTLYWSVRSRDRSGNWGSWSTPLRFRVYVDDGVLHAGGDADRVLGCATAAGSRPGAALALAAIAILAAAIRRRAFGIALLCTAMASCGQDWRKDPVPPPPPDLTPPAVVSTDPLDGATGVSPNPAVSVTFSEPVQLWTLTAAFHLTADGVDVPCIAVLDGTTATFTPGPGVPPPSHAAQYTATIDPGVRDEAGNRTGIPYQWSFTSADGAWAAEDLVDGGVGYVSAPQVAVDGAGNSFALWVQNDGFLWDDAVARRHVRGSGWQASAPVEQAIGYAASPQLCANGSGVCFAVWLHDGQVMTNRYAPATGWGTEMVLDNQTSTAPQIGLDDSGNAVAVWFRGTELRTARYSNGTGWGTASSLGTYPSFVSLLRLAVNPLGSAVATWVQNANPGYTLRARRFDPASGWAAAEAIRTPATATLGGNQVAIAPSGAVFAVWSETLSGISSIWSERFVPGQGWRTPELVETDDAGNALNPQVQADRSGNALVVWQQAFGGPAAVMANRFDEAMGSWSGAVTVQASTEAASRVRLAMDQAGHAIAVWTQASGSIASLWTSRFNPAAGWSAPALLETDDTAAATAAQISMNASGAAAAVWVQSDADGLPRIRMRRFQ